VSALLHLPAPVHRVFPVARRRDFDGSLSTFRSAISTGVKVWWIIKTSFFARACGVRSERSGSSYPRSEVYFFGEIEVGEIEVTTQQRSAPLSATAKSEDGNRGFR
jgi:hypothetical protein